MLPKLGDELRTSVGNDRFWYSMLRNDMIDNELGELRRGESGGCWDEDRPFGETIDDDKN